MKKRGIGHVEIIISFLLFISVVFFVFYFLNPAEKTGISDATIEYVFDAVHENIASEVYSYTVNTKDGNLISYPTGMSGKRFVLNDENGAVVDYGDINGKICVNSADLVMLRFSDDLIMQDSGSCEGKKEGDVIFSTKDSFVLENKIISLNESYYSDYEKLKEDLGIPPSIEFGFEAVFSGGESIKADRKIPNGISVFSKSDRLTILRKDGSLVYGNLAVKTW